MKLGIRFQSMGHILQLPCGQQEFAAAQGQHVILFHILENTVDGTKGAAGFGGAGPPAA